MTSLTWINANTVRKLINRSDLFKLLESGLGKYSKGEAGGIVQPVRSTVEVHDKIGYLGTMPCYSKFDNILSTKLVTFYPGNVQVPTHHAWIMHFDPGDGSLLAVMDGEVITAVRTGLVSAVATKYLVRKDSKVLALIGAGVQARSHYEALRPLYEFNEIRIWNRTKQNALKLADEIKASSNAPRNTTTITNDVRATDEVRVTTCESVQEAVKDADIICVATFATEPILRREWVKRGAHINAVGAVRPDWQELDGDLMTSSRVYCDTREGCLKESGDVIKSKCNIHGEIGEVINGTVEAGVDDTTVFKSVGMAIEDGICAKYIYDKYVARTPNSL